MLKDLNNILDDMDNEASHIIRRNAKTESEDSKKDISEIEIPAIEPPSFIDNPEDLDGVMGGVIDPVIDPPYENIEILGGILPPPDGDLPNDIDELIDIN